MMKTTLFIGVVLLLMVGGYFALTNFSADTEEEITEQIAVETQLDVYRDTTLGFQFSYPNSYITFEDNESTDSDFFSGIKIFDREEYEAFSESTDAREGPPAMHVRIYENPEKLHSPVWAMRKPLETNYGLIIGEQKEAVVGGANAVHYVVDGLYPIDTYVVASGDRIYVLMGSYRDTDEAIYQDFQKLVESFTFIEPGTAVGKLDVTTACQYALTYTTFMSGAEAAAFVAECIEGEHPEVIERYISDMGLSGAAI